MGRHKICSVPIFYSDKSYLHARQQITTYETGINLMFCQFG